MTVYFNNGSVYKAGENECRSNSFKVWQQSDQKNATIKDGNKFTV